MTNNEFTRLMNITKRFVKNNIRLPLKGEYAVFDLKGDVDNEKFILDINRKGKLTLSKFTIQNRYAPTKLPLVRVDFDSPPHTNPDGTQTSRNHIHIYREISGVKDDVHLPWAYDLNDIPEFNNARADFMDIFNGFCGYCNIIVDNVQGVI